jgi:hypothetical protein
LKGYDIVLGKIVAASVNWLFGLLALFPVLALSLLMGGVAPGEFWRKILALTNLLFYSLALGMFVSSFTRSERRAAALTLVLLILLVWVLPEVAEWRQKRTGALELSPWFVFPDIGSAWRFAEDYRFNRRPEFYWWSLGVSHGLGWLYLLLASLIVPHTWQQQAGKMSRWQENAEQLTYGRNRERRKRFRERALAINPFYWVAGRARGKMIGPILAIIGTVGLFSISWSIEPKAWDSPWSFLWPAFWLHCILKIWLAFEACRRFVEDRRTGALELILSTPLAPATILRGQWQALLKQFATPVFVVLCIDLVLACVGMSKGRSVSINKISEEELFAMMLAADVIVFIADLFALAWLSMWRGMKARHSYTALLWTMLQVLAGPWVLFYVCLTAVMMLVFLPRVASAKGGVVTATTSFWDEWMPVILVVLWFVISLAVALFSAWWGRRALLKYFRYQATVSYQPAKPLWSPRPQPAKLPPRLA